MITATIIKKTCLSLKNLFQVTTPGSIISGSSLVIFTLDLIPLKKEKLHCTQEKSLLCRNILRTAWSLTATAASKNLRKQPLLWKDKPVWGCESYSQALTSYPHFSLIIPADQEKRNSSEKAFSSCTLWNSFALSWLFTKGKYENNSKANNIVNVFHDWTKHCLAVTFIVYRNPESTVLHLSVFLCKSQESL